MDPSKSGSIPEMPPKDSTSLNSVSSADLRSRHVQLSGNSLMSTTGARARTVKESVINLKTLTELSQAHESDESITTLPTSFWELVMHRWKKLVGTGVLAMPYAFAHSGWLVGIFSIIIINVGFRYCFQACLNIVEIVGPKVEDETSALPEMMGIAFESGPVYFKWLHRPWKYIWHVLHAILMFGVCASYILFIAVNMGQIYQDIDITWNIRIWVLLVYAAIAVVSAIPNMRRLVPFTIVAAFLQTVGLILLMYFLTKDLPPLKDRDWNRPIAEMSTFLGIACFASGPMSFVFLMDLNTKLSLTAANVSTLLSTLIYSLVGVFGYWKYGKECRASVTFNLPTMWEFPEWIRLTFIVGVFLLYVNNLHSFLHSIWATYIGPRLTLSPILRQCLRYLFRLLFVTLNMALVMAIPRLGTLMSLNGIAAHFIFGFIFVPAAELSCLWPDNLGRYYWKAVRNILIISCSILIAIPALVHNVYIIFDSVHGKDFFTCNINATWGISKLAC